MAETRRPDQQRRLYSLRQEPFVELEGWLANFRGLWEARLDRFEVALKERVAAGRTKPEEPQCDEFERSGGEGGCPLYKPLQKFERQVQRLGMESLDAFSRPIGVGRSTRLSRRTQPRSRKMGRGGGISDFVSVPMFEQRRHRAH